MNKGYQKTGDETKHDESEKVTQTRGDSRNNIVWVAIELWQITTRAHMNEPRTIPEREAAAIEVAETMTNLINESKNT